MEIFQNILIAFFGITAVAGGVFVLTQANPVRAALGLLSAMVSIGFIFIAIGAYFIGFVQLIIYAGAIVILFLFAVMQFPVGKMRRDRAAFTTLFGIVLAGILGLTLLANVVLHATNFGTATGFAEGNIYDAAEIGRRFLSDWLYPFELVGLLLLVAIVSAIYLTRSPIKTGNDGGGDSG